MFKLNLMERPPMTDDMMSLRSLVEKSADADLLCEMIGFAAEKLRCPVAPAWGAGVVKSTKGQRIEPRWGAATSFDDLRQILRHHLKHLDRPARLACRIPE